MHNNKNNNCNKLLQNRKKSQISIQFNWILVLIIGGIILTFFITIAQKQKEHTEEGISVKIQTDLQAILTSSQISTGTASIVDFPKKEIVYNCEGFKIGKQFAAKFPYAFAPNSILSSRSTISLYSYSWNTPYRVTNFLYVTSPDVMYIIVDENLNDQNSLGKTLNRLLPSEYIYKNGKSNLFMNREIIDAGDLIKDTGNYKIRAIYLDSDFDPAHFDEITKTKLRDITALTITPDDSLCQGASEDKLNCFGKLEFYNYDREISGWKMSEAKYIGLASLFAAIFSEENETYECGMTSAFERLEKITAIYESRTEDLSDAYQDSLSLSCSELYSDVLELDGEIDKIKSATQSMDYSALYAASNKLKNRNDNILASSCPALY